MNERDSSKMIPSPNQDEFRIDGSLFVMLGMNVFFMACSVHLQYNEPMFTLLIGTVYGPVLAATILLVSKVHIFIQYVYYRMVR